MTDATPRNENNIWLAIILTMCTVKQLLQAVLILEEPIAARVPNMQLLFYVGGGISNSYKSGDNRSCGCTAYAFDRCSGR